MGDAVSEAAAVAVETGSYELSVEWLEQGRSVVWGQMLHLRTPMDALRDVDSDLAMKLEQVSRDLENASSSSMAEQLHSGRTFSLEAEAQGHRRLAEEWENLLQRARALPGFDNFLLPKTFAELAQATHSGAIAMINVHKSRCDALVMLDGGEEVIHVPLPLSYGISIRLARNLQNSMEHLRTSQRGTRIGRPEDKFEDMLASLWSNVVSPILEALAYLW